MFFSAFRRGDDYLGVAVAPSEFTNDSLPAVGRVDRWERPVLCLRQGTFTDFLSCNLIWHLCSSKMREIIEKAAGAALNVQWLPVEIRSDSGERREYFILHMLEIPDVVDKGRSTFVGNGVLIKPHINLRRAEGLKLFKLSRTNVGLVVSEDIKDAVQSAGCTGVDFRAIRQS
jgi:hypothetical protein